MIRMVTILFLHNSSPAWREVFQDLDIFEDAGFASAMGFYPFRHPTDAIFQSRFRGIAKYTLRLAVV